MEDIPQENQGFSGTYLSTSDVMRATGVTLRQLYYWEKSDLIHPKFENEISELLEKLQNPKKVKIWTKKKSAN